jgi:hypothetical protein
MVTVVAFVALTVRSDDDPEEIDDGLAPMATVGGMEPPGFIFADTPHPVIPDTNGRQTINATKGKMRKPGHAARKRILLPTFHRRQHSTTTMHQGTLVLSRRLLTISYNLASNSEN